MHAIFFFLHKCAEREILPGQSRCEYSYASTTYSGKQVRIHVVSEKEKKMMMMMLVIIEVNAYSTVMIVQACVRTIRVRTPSTTWYRVRPGF